MTMILMIPYKRTGGLHIQCGDVYVGYRLIVNFASSISQIHKPVGPTVLVPWFV